MTIPTDVLRDGFIAAIAVRLGLRVNLRVNLDDLTCCYKWVAQQEYMDNKITPQQAADAILDYCLKEL